MSEYTYHREFGGHTIHIVEDAAPGGYDREALCGRRTVLIGGPAPLTGLCRRCEALMRAATAQAPAEEPSLFE